MFFNIEQSFGVARIKIKIYSQMQCMNSGDDIVRLEKRLLEWERDLVEFLMDRDGRVDSFDIRRKVRSLEVKIRETWDTSKEGDALAHTRGLIGAMHPRPARRVPLKKLDRDRFELPLEELEEVRIQTIQLLGILRIATFRQEGRTASQFLKRGIKAYHRMGSGHMHYLSKELFYFFRARPRVLLSSIMYEQFREYCLDWLRRMDREIKLKDKYYGEGI